MEEHNNSTKPIENLTSFTAVLFEPEVIEEWIDPFDSITLKFLTIIVYIIEVFASIVMLFFVAYETRGYAGHYRTVINQLLSCAYGAVRKIIDSKVKEIFVFRK